MAEVNPWQGRRVFLTGHTGFKGGWLALWLARRGAQVRGYSIEPFTKPNMFTESSVAEVVEDVRGDTRDYAKLESSMKEFAPEVVFHLAAQPIVRRSYLEPIETFSTNVMGTAHVMEAIRQTPSVRAVVCITTDKVYQNQEWVWPYRETDPLGGHDPYSASKACAEIVSAGYRSSYFSPEKINEHQVLLATARAGNVIGGGDWSEYRLIPDLIRAFQAGRSVLIRFPGATRPWQHVLEPLNGYITLAERLLARQTRFASSFNFGPSTDDIWPVERIANKAVELWGEGASWTRESTVPPVHEDRFLQLDASKARFELGWQPRLRIESALEWTIAWYRAWKDGENMREFTWRQIGKFEELRSQTK
ncbi:MAG TPA: CDP-glucose 4,6-dehydratase [Terracidiphilus sp.]|jgi:CDP-glucose 4,6-dehydratase